MSISFSTICEQTAKKFFESEKYNYLSESAKVEALKHIGAGKLRVQDPLMYPRPSLEISTQEIYDLIMAANKNKD